MSQSVTDRGENVLLLLQNETKAGVGLIVLIERGKSPALGSMARQKWEIIHARIQTGEIPPSILSESPISPLYIGANGPVSKHGPAHPLHYTKVFPREMSSQHANLPSFISKLSKTAGQRYIDTPGTVYLEVFVDRPQGHIVLSFSFAGAAVQKTKGPADT